MGVSGPVNRVPRLLASLNCDGGRGFVLLGLCALLVLPALGGEELRLWGRYDRAALAAGQLWRLVTAHLMHLSVRHALLNTCGLVLMWVLFARDYLARQWLVIVVAAAAAIDAGLWLCSSTIQWYVGSSGVLHGVMAAGTLAQLRRGQREGWLLALVLLVKLVYEHLAGALPLSGRETVVVDAHLYGVLGGVLAAAFMKPRALPL
jgi:rhomboid family GlyGly-CTERM serine protease